MRVVCRPRGGGSGSRSGEVSLRILFITTGPKENPGPRTRVFQYLPYFERDGVDCAVIEAGSRWPMELANRAGQLNGFDARGLSRAAAVARSAALRSAVRVAQAGNVPYQQGMTVWGSLLAVARGYDVVFVQGIVVPPILMKALHAAGKPVVFDLCDALHVKKGRIGQRIDVFHELLPLWDLVVLATPEVESYVRANGNQETLVITGPIDTQLYHPRLEPRRDGEPVRIGWVGSSSTTRYLELVRGALVRICRDFPNVVVDTIGAERMTGSDLRLHQRPWTLEGEPKDLQAFDIGIMPLANDEWCRGKGAYKLLQYMAVGIPSVASPVGVNTDVIVQGENGYLADSEDEWYLRLAELVRDAETRARMGRVGREMAVQKYSFETYYPVLKHAIERLLS